MRVPLGCAIHGGTAVLDLQIVLDTAIEAGTTVVQFHASVPTDTAPDTIDRILALGRDFTVEELPELHGP